MIPTCKHIWSREKVGTCKLLKVLRENIEHRLKDVTVINSLYITYYSRLSNYTLSNYQNVSWDSGQHNKFLQILYKYMYLLLPVITIKEI